MGSKPIIEHNNRLKANQYAEYITGKALRQFSEYPNKIEYWTVANNPKVSTPQELAWVR